MRIDVEETPELAQNFNGTILLDGIPMANNLITTADEEQGYIIHLRVDTMGNFELDDAGLNLKVYRSYGKVEIVFAESIIKLSDSVMRGLL